MMFKWLFHILIFATSGKYQNKEKPLKRQRKLGLYSSVNYLDPDILGNPAVTHSITLHSFTLHLKCTGIGHTCVTGMSNGMGHT